jgi:hypothetical protein
MRMRSCLAGALLLWAAAARAEDWPQWQGPRRDGVWTETGILDRFPKGGPKVLWRQPLGGGFTGPAVADGRVYVMDRQGEQLAKGKEAPGKGGLAGKERLLCLDAASGAVRWKHEYYLVDIMHGFSILYDRRIQTCPKPSRPPTAT